MIYDNFELFFPQNLANLGDSFQKKNPLYELHAFFFILSPSDGHKKGGKKNSASHS
jgi:hypothetical protein